MDVVLFKAYLIKDTLLKTEIDSSYTIGIPLKIWQSQGSFISKWK